MVFQSYALFPHMTVLENVRYGLDVAGVAKQDAIARAHDTLASVGLRDFDARLPAELSGGQQQRVALARALVLEPSVLLFDEPLSNLDARLRRRMREEIRELQQRLGLTVVYVTHDQAEAMAVSDRIVVMNHGAIAQEGTPRDLYEQPCDAFVAGFMGDANRVAATIARRDDRLADVDIGGVSLVLPHRGLADGAGRRLHTAGGDRARPRGFLAASRHAAPGGVSRQRDRVHDRHARGRALRRIGRGRRAARAGHARRRAPRAARRGRDPG